MNATNVSFPAATSATLAALLTSLALLLAAPAVAQDLDAIELKCSQTKLKAAGKSSSCVHKAWAKAAGRGELPDLTRCEEKLNDKFSKAEDRAARTGGACAVGQTADQVNDALAEAADLTVTQVSRGTVSPAPDACDGLAKDVAFAGGDYSKFPKCVELQTPETDCSGTKTKRKMAEALRKDFSCPGCPEGEEGCTSSVNIFSFGLYQIGINACCLRADSINAKKSETFTITCSVCVAS